MSFTDDLLTILSSYHKGYRLMRRRMHGDTRPLLPPRLRDASEGTLRVTLSRLKKRGLAKNEKGLWHLSEKGLAYLKRKLGYPTSSSRHGKRPNNMIVAFDIPEKFRPARDWLRIELRILGFEILQKSVWFGPAPLPKEFLERLHELKILKFIKFLKAEEWDIV